MWIYFSKIYCLKHFTPKQFNFIMQPTKYILKIYRTNWYGMKNWTKIDQKILKFKRVSGSNSAVNWFIVIGGVKFELNYIKLFNTSAYFISFWLKWFILLLSIITKVGSITITFKL